jgi:hypothetical protein
VEKERIRRSENEFSGYQKSLGSYSQLRHSLSAVPEKATTVNVTQTPRQGSKKRFKILLLQGGQYERI